MFERSSLPIEWSYWPIQPLRWKIYSRPFQRSVCFYVHLNIKMRNIAKQIYCLLPLLLFFHLVEKLVPYKNRLFFKNLHREHFASIFLTSFGHHRTHFWRNWRGVMSSLYWILSPCRVELQWMSSTITEIVGCSEIVLKQIF